ncbi:MAG: type II toxin-antitoxin system PemK/MazF family toxin [Bacillota bacterium]|nr:type II toxin-antitoxin system PemK/MazF family toxin [Bacillota bacterium]
MIKRGEIYFAQLNPVVGSEQGGIRPVLVVQNDIGNQYSPTTIILAITSQINKAKLPTHVELRADQFGMERDSVVLTEQIRTIDKTRLKQRIAILNDETMKKVEKALLISLELNEILNT